MNTNKLIAVPIIDENHKLQPDHTMPATSDLALVYQQYGQAVVRIQDRDGNTSGTGFFVEPGPFVATAYHVVQNAHEFVVRLASGVELPATVACADPHADVALLRLSQPVPDGQLHCLQIAASDQICSRQRLYVLGYAGGLDVLYASVGVHEITEPVDSRWVPGCRSTVVLVTCDLPVTSGSSGSPLMTRDGLVVGVCSLASEGKTRGSLRLSFHTSAEHLSLLLEHALEQPPESVEALYVTNVLPRIRTSRSRACSPAA
jgi:S1-C subfamily serine protease